MRLTGRIAGWALAAALIGGLATEAAAQAVGVLAAVNRDVTGKRPQEPPRQLVLRERLILNERVSTNSLGGGQVLFLDQTSLTLSPNSDIVLDRYLYDPETRTGDLTVSVLKGAMRLVGGRITKQGVATIRTPSATIGIRGGIGNVNVGADGGTTYMHIAGISSTISTGGGSVTVTREGGVVKVAARPSGGGSGGGSGGDGSSGGGSGSGGSGGDESGGDDTGGDGSGGDESGGDGSGGDGSGAGGSGGEATGGGGGDAPPPEYVGVATPEMVNEEFSSGTGSGDGGLELQLSPEAVEQEMQPVEQEITGAEGAVKEGPISTQGEQETSSTDDPSTTNEPPQDEISDSNIAGDVADNIDNVLDAISFDGTWQAFAALSNGQFALQQQPGGELGPYQDLKFQMNYSLVSQSGLVAVELPPTGDVISGITDLNGDPLNGDKFAVMGNLAQQLVGDASTLSELGGDASDTVISITSTETADIATGNIFIDYTNSSLALTDFVDGDIDPTSGVRVQNEEFEQDITDFVSQNRE